MWHGRARLPRLLALAGLGCARSSQLAEGHVFEGPWSEEPPESTGTRLRVVSWNVAAVNNNPFEYWITHPNPEYAQLMEDVERFVVDPGTHDVRIDELFTDVMFRRVMDLMRDTEMASPEMLARVEVLWEKDYRKRRVVSEFLTDALIGKKRLASMPDRVTNTIQLQSGGFLFRPAVGNCYGETWSDLDDWFERWLDFFFKTSVDLDGKGARPMYSLLPVIKKSKYPAVTEEEEAVSQPLQLVVQGIFDTVLVDLMSKKGGGSWQELRREICASLNDRKNQRLLEILKSTYSSADVIFLQEAGNQLVSLLREGFPEHYVVLPKSYSAKRNQNSVMMLRSAVFSEPTEVDIPEDGWEAGDLLVVTSVVSGKEVTLASFHGDTNGLLTMPMLSKVASNLPAEPLLFGMDANTYEKNSTSTAHVLEFETMYKELGLQACWGDVDPQLYTTFNARTYLQPQLNKAARSRELAEKGDRNPKDFILFTDHFSSGRVWRDNSGDGVYTEDMVFPTLEFPSDHAAIAADMVLWGTGDDPNAESEASAAGKGRGSPSAGKGREALAAAGKDRETKPEL